MNPSLDFYFLDTPKWKEEIEILRGLVLECGLTEELKWKVPCYTFQGKNILIIGVFKDFCSLNFFKGSLLSDEHSILQKQGENSQVGRSIKFQSKEEIIQRYSVLKSYIYEAIEVEKAGIKIEYPKPTDLPYPTEFKEILAKKPTLKTAFENLTPGRQKAYILHFSGAKQSQTIINRIEKYIPQILNGKGINDCTCGFSQKMPICDGSHKFHKQQII